MYPLVAYFTRLFVLVQVFLLLGTVGYGQSANFSFTEIPYSQAEVIAPGRGVEQWHDQNHVNVPVEGTNTQRIDKYYRFIWSELEVGNRQYDWRYFDSEIRNAISRGQKFSFGIMSHNASANAQTRGIVNTGDGRLACYPRYLHDQMMSESVKPWVSSQTNKWVPNWNSNYYLAAMEDLHAALNQYIMTASYNGVRYRDVVNYIDIRGYGSYGEWHQAGIINTMSEIPSGARATTATLKRIIDAHVNKFTDFPLTIIFNAFDGNRLGNTMNAPEVAYHALTVKNNWGLVGWRRDNWGALDDYIKWYTEQNTLTVSGMRLDTAIMNRWKYAPIVGEPNNGGVMYNGCDYGDLENQVRKYHAVSFGNGNMFSLSSACGKNNVRAASKAAGYRMLLTGGNVSNSTIPTGSSFRISLDWKNAGVAPTYENWNVVYQLKNSSGTVVWTGNSSFKLKWFLPATTSTTHSDNFTLPSSVANGSYALSVIIRDPNNYRQPFTLNIQGRANDGSYPLGSVTVTTGSGNTNQAPVANAGPDRSIQLPVNTASLDGSGSNDPDGSISTYAWSQVSGPATASFNSASVASPTVSGLLAGTYRFRLTVTDNGGLTATDEVTVQVTAATAANQAPVANAGADRTIQLPTNSVALNGSGSSDPDGNITAYLWSQVSGPSTATISSTTATSPIASALQVGTYVFRLRVTDNGGLTATDEVTIRVNAAANQAPVANAGPDRTIQLPTNSVALNGSGSSDPDGTIAAYLWTQVSGPSTATISSTTATSPTASALQAGTYIFRLRVTDNGGLTANDEVTITVNAAANQAPVANAGADRTITLPTNLATLNGNGSSDPDGTIAAYLWTQVSGPATATFSSTTSATPTVRDLVEGVYVFRLRVTDNGGLTATDEVTIRVNTASNQTPVANAGADRTIQLPTNSVTLNGSGSSDPDGTIAAYLWTQVSGPSTATISSTTAVSTTVSALQAGTYIFRLRVTDNGGLTANDEVTITVNAAPNQAPVANAGADRTITLPTNLATLNGNGSSDADGTIAAYLWTQVSGPATATFSSTTSATPTVRDLVEGVYVFRLRVTDNGGLTATDEVTIRVNAAANQAPVANAGADRTIQLPTNEVSLNGSGSSDPDGTIAAYLWTQVSGPSTATFSSTTAVSTTVSALEAGTYVFRLRVTDNGGLTATDEVSIRVNAAANQSPVAHAGNNRSVTLPTNYITLNGGSSKDPDGTITAYRWSQLSGPATATFSTTTAITTTVRNLQLGVYRFQLEVTDNSGARSTATVTVTVLQSTNVAPVADAGPDQQLNAGTTRATLNARNSFDRDGSIVSYSWKQVSGPGNAIIVNSNADSTEVRNLAAGEYNFVLTVTDNRGATSTDTVKVTVENYSGTRGFVYPNPAHNVINVGVTSHTSATMRFTILDISGRVVAPVVTKEVSAGYSVVQLNIYSLKPGKYLIQISNRQNKKVSVYSFVKI